MTDLATRIADVKQKAEAATPGPWFVGAMNDGLFVIDQPPRPSNDDVQPKHKVKCLAKFEYAEKANADYTAAASPDLILAMAARIEELEKALEPWRGFDFFVAGKPDDFAALEVKHNGETKVLVTAAQIRAAASALKGEI
jgi:hypothetical protein